MNQAIIDSKKAVVSEIAKKMKESQSTVVVEYRGLSVAEVTELRRNLREEGVEFKVYKNSLAQRAAVEAGADDLTKDLILVTLISRSVVRWCFHTEPVKHRRSVLLHRDQKSRKRKMPVQISLVEKNCWKTSKRDGSTSM